MTKQIPDATLNLYFLIWSRTICSCYCLLIHSCRDIIGSWYICMVLLKEEGGLQIFLSSIWWSICWSYDWYFTYYSYPSFLTFFFVSI